MTKRKRNIIIVSVVFGALALLIGGGMLALYILFTSNPEYRMNSAADAALKKFELDEVLVSRPILYNHTFLSEYNLDWSSFDYRTYVLGVKDGEEIFILAPRYQKDELIQIDWPLQHSFTECIDALNEYVGATICEKADYSKIDFYGNIPKSEDYCGAVFDAPFAIILHDAHFEDFIIGENEGQIVISRQTPSTTFDQEASE